MRLRDRIDAHCPAFLRPWWERLDASPIGRRLAGGAFWSVLGSAVSRTLLVLSTIACARILGKEGFGAFGLVQSAATAFQSFLFFGLSLTASRYVAELKEHEPERAGRIIGLSNAVALITGLIFAVLIWAFSHWYSADFLDEPKLKSAFQVCAAIVLAGSALGALNGALAGFGAFSSQARVNILSGLVHVVAIPVGAYSAGIEGAVWGVFVGTMANAVLAWMDLLRHARKARVKVFERGMWGEWRVLLNFSLPAVVSSALMTPVIWITYSFLAKMENGFEYMAVITAAMQWRAIVMFLPQKMSPVFTTNMSQELAAGSKEGFRRVLWVALVANAAVALALTVLIVIASPWIMKMYGPAYEGSHWAFSALVAGGVFVALDYALNRGLAAVDMMWWVFGASVVWAIIYVGISLWLIPTMFIFGLIIATLSADFIRPIIEVILLSRSDKFLTGEASTK